MDTTEKGELAKAATIFRLTQQGWCVSLPISEHAPYDLIAERDGVCRRVQVKHAANHTDYIHASLKSVMVNCSKTTVRTRERGDWDAVALFDPVTTNVFFVLDSQVDNTTGIRLRLTPSRQVKGVRYASDHVELV